MAPDEFAPLVSKVLVLDDDDRCHGLIKNFCTEAGLVPVKPQGDPMAVLRTNVDLGAVLLGEQHGHRPGRGIALAREIHRARPELPIFLRREAVAALDDLDEDDARLFRIGWTAADLAPLRDAVAGAIFTRAYPRALVQGICDLTCRAIEGQFPQLAVTHEAPCLVKDRIIFGELFTLIPLESDWCRGYMMLQADEQPLRDFLSCGAFGPADDSGDFREMNNVLGETTNLVWGAFKNRFIHAGPDTSRLTQVPIIVNHLHRYISFGADDPLLCVKYRLAERGTASRGSVEVYQWFAFNLSWTPDNFKETSTSVEALCASGELEWF